MLDQNDTNRKIGKLFETPVDRYRKMNFFKKIWWLFLNH